MVQDYAFGAVVMVASVVMEVADRDQRGDEEYNG